MLSSENLDRFLRDQGGLEEGKIFQGYLDNNW
jgi:hypothetical protein